MRKWKGIRSYHDTRLITGDWSTTTEGNRKEQSSGYEDGFYWQYLLARSKVPISGITEVTKSKLLDFSIDYP